MSGRISRHFPQARAEKTKNKGLFFSLFPTRLSRVRYGEFVGMAQTTISQVWLSRPPVFRFTIRALPSASNFASACPIADDTGGIPAAQAAAPISIRSSLGVSPSGSSRSADRMSAAICVVSSIAYLPSIRCVRCSLRADGCARAGPPLPVPGAPAPRAPVCRVSRRCCRETGFRGLASRR